MVLHQIGAGNPELGADSTTGIQDDTATNGLEYQCNTPGSVPDDTAVAFFLCPTITIAPGSPLPDGTEGQPYSVTLTASGGLAPYGNWVVTAGTLPTGLALDIATGELAGTPAIGSQGTYNFTVEVTDDLGCTGTMDYELTIIPGCDGVNIVIDPPTLPPGTINVAYSVTLTASGGTGPYSYALIAGNLPAGLALDGATGVISGTPTTAGCENFTIEATDAATCTGQQIYDLCIEHICNVLVGAGLEASNSNRVRAFDQSLVVQVDFYAYGAGQWGTNVAGGNVDNTINWEIITGPGPGDVYGPHVRGWQWDETPMGKINFYAYNTLKFGVNVAAAMVDADIWHEILTGAGPGGVFGPHVRGWNFDAVGITPMGKINFFAYLTLKWGVNVDDSDVDGDGFDEIITGAGPGLVFAATVRGWNFDGVTLSSIAKINYNAYPSAFGVRVAGGNVDGDGFGEIVTAPGPDPTVEARFRGWNFDATTIAQLTNYDTTLFTGFMYGGRCHTCDTNADGRDELLAAAAPDILSAPPPDSTIEIWDYDPSTSTLSQLTTFVPFLGEPEDQFGANPAGAKLGY
jgi:hypothetical protein